MRFTFDWYTLCLLFKEWFDFCPYFSSILLLICHFDFSISSPLTILIQFSPGCIFQLHIGPVGDIGGAVPEHVPEHVAQGLCGRGLGVLIHCFGNRLITITF